jgi:hypothetical protein
VVDVLVEVLVEVAGVLVLVEELVDVELLPLEVLAPVELVELEPGLKGFDALSRSSGYCLSYFPLSQSSST